MKKSILNMLLFFSPNFNCARRHGDIGNVPLTQALSIECCEWLMLTGAARSANQEQEGLSLGYVACISVSLSPCVIPHVQVPELADPSDVTYIPTLPTERVYFQNEFKPSKFSNF